MLFMFSAAALTLKIAQQLTLLARVGSLTFVRNCNAIAAL